MNVALRRPMTLPEFLDWEERQEERYEFDGFQPVAMAGGTAAHAALQRNLLFSLTGRLRGQWCLPFGSELKVEAAGHIRYPDAFVVCTPVPPDAKVVTEPVVVFEILSEGSIGDDLIVKNAEYRATPSVQRYIVLQQTHRSAITFHRKGEDWVAEPLTREGAMLRMLEIGAEIPLDELYLDAGLAAGADAG